VVQYQMVVMAVLKELAAFISTSIFRVQILRQLLIQWIWKHRHSPKRRQLCTNGHGVKSQKTLIFTATAMKTSNLAFYTCLSY